MQALGSMELEHQKVETPAMTVFIRSIFPQMTKRLCKILKKDRLDPGLC